MPDNSRWDRLASGLALLAATGANGMTVMVSPSVPSPTPVATLVTFTASVPDAPAAANLWYRFRVRKEGGVYQLIRDYGPVNALDWTAVDHDGSYEVEVSARDLNSGEQAAGSLPFQFQSRVGVGQPVVSPTANSLVFLYSAPACDAGSRMRVQFQRAAGPVQYTPYQACSPGASMNFYLAGLLANTAYTAQHTVDTGSAFESGPEVSFTTGQLPSGLYSDTILVPGDGGTSNPFLLGGPLGGNPVANDLTGNVVWYGPVGITFLTHVEPGGVFWGIVEADGDSSQQVVRKFDLAGMTLLETNAARVNEQLTAMGKRTITGFHHEAVPVAGGRLAVLAADEQILTGVQGPGPVDILGDMIIVFDQDLNVVWSWDSFDYLNVNRPAVLGETCPMAGCPAFYLAPMANDWTHGNSLQETADGNLLYSVRNQDWLVKISFDGGTGDGHVIWRLGIDGDFQMDSTGLFPWFSHQHDASFEPGNPSRLMVFDDGNTRVAQLRGGNSRGQVLQVDETNLVVTPVLNADLGVYASAVGSAQHLHDGNYHFDAGFVQEDNNVYDSYSIEVDASSQIRYEAHQNVILYRTFRLSDMYTPN